MNPTQNIWRMMAVSAMLSTLPSIAFARHAHQMSWLGWKLEEPKSLVYKNEKRVAISSPGLFFGQVTTFATRTHAASVSDASNNANVALHDRPTAVAFAASPVKNMYATAPIADPPLMFQEEDDLALRAMLNVEEGGLVTVGRVAGFVAGCWAAALTHELGHAMVAWGYGHDFLWPTNQERSELFLPLWQTRPSRQELSTEEMRNIGAGGFLLSAAISETMLASDAFPKSDVFVGGYIFYDLVNAVVYVVRDLLSRSGNQRGIHEEGIGDIRDMRRGGVPHEVVYTILLTRSALVLARVLEDPDFLELSYWWSSAQPY